MLTNFIVIALLVIGIVILLEKGDQLMATFEDVKATLASVASGVDRLEAQIADLKQQVKNGGVITQAQLDELSASAAAIGTDIDDTSDQG